MPSVVAKSVSASLISWTGTGYRLIPSRFPPVHVYEGLVDSDRFEALAELEALTNPRLISEARLARTSSAPLNENRVQNWNLAPFAYGNPEGSTFFGEERSCMEVAGDCQTALAVAVARRERFLSCTREAAIGLDMRLLKTPIAGQFWDLRPLGVIGDLQTRRDLGKALPEGADGILFCAPERPSGTALCVLNGECLGRSLQTTHYRFVWDGANVCLLYAFDNEGMEIDPRRLSGEADILAA